MRMAERSLTEEEHKLLMEVLYGLITNLNGICQVISEWGGEGGANPGLYGGRANHVLKKNSELLEELKKLNSTLNALDKDRFG